MLRGAAHSRRYRLTQARGVVSVPRTSAREKVVGGRVWSQNEWMLSQYDRMNFESWSFVCSNDHICILIVEVWMIIYEIRRRVGGVFLIRHGERCVSAYPKRASLKDSNAMRVVWSCQLARRLTVRSTILSPSKRMASTVNKSAHPFNKPNLEALLNRRFFYAPAFEIYGGMCK